MTTRSGYTRRHRAAITTFALVVAAPLGALTLTRTAHADDRTNVVVEWNRTLLGLVQTAGAQPATIQPTRDFAIMSAAVLDAVDATHPGQPQYLLQLTAEPGASAEAAAAQAAHDVLVAMFPAFQDKLDQQLANDLAAVPEGRRRSRGTAVGAEAAGQLLQLRASDGSGATPPPYTSSGAPGDYRPTPPGFSAPVFTHWSAVQPFVLNNADQFRPEPPPMLSSPAYAQAINEVQDLGQDTSTSRSAEQTTIGKFWAAPIQNYWNAIADDLTIANRDDTARSALTLALVDLGLADATIAMYDAKYFYRLWRPISAIRLADTDSNPQTTANPDWTPLATTPADPSYPGAHSTLSAAAATVLSALYGTHVAVNVTSPTLPGVTRTFDSLQAVESEAGLSRIYAGVHTRLDHEAGLALGRQIGAYTLTHTLPATKPS
jgi:membrane-associated phospholipid phosphatase